MASTWQTWLMSAVAATGVAGGGAIGLASASAPAHDTLTPPAQQPAGVDTGELQAQVAQLLAEDQALHAALAQARSRLGDEVRASEASLRSLRTQLAAAQAALAARRQAASAPQPAPPPAPSSRPSAHTTTGASGTGSGAGHDDGGDGGHDD